MADDLRNEFRCRSIFIDSVNAERFHIFQVFFGEKISQLERILFFFSRALDDFVVDIRDILKVKNIQVLPSEIFHEKIEKNICSRVAEVRLVVDRGAADKQPEPFSFAWFHNLFFPRKRVKKPDGHLK